MPDARRWKKKSAEAAKVLGLPDHSQRSIAHLARWQCAAGHPLLSFATPPDPAFFSMTDGGSSVDGRGAGGSSPVARVSLRPTGRPVTSS